MAKKGRRDKTGTRNQDTIAAGSAEQAMLEKQDIILQALREIRDAATLGDAQTALGTLDLTDVELK